MSTPDTAETGIATTFLERVELIRDAADRILRGEDAGFMWTTTLVCEAGVITQDYDNFGHPFAVPLALYFPGTHSAILTSDLRSLEADSRRLDVLEELCRGFSLQTGRAGSAFPVAIFLHDAANTRDGLFHSLREAADAEILRRSNTGDTNG